MVRVGTAIYGYEINNRNLKQSFSLVTKILNILQIKNGDNLGYGYTVKTNTTIAIIGIGYADGLPQVVNTGHVIVGSQLCKILCIAMDVTFIDVGLVNPIPNIGGLVTLFDNIHTIDEFSSGLGVSSDYILTHINSTRVQYNII